MKSESALFHQLQPCVDVVKILFSLDLFLVQFQRQFVVGGFEEVNVVCDVLDSDLQVAVNELPQGVDGFRRVREQRADDERRVELINHQREND